MQAQTLSPEEIRAEIARLETRYKAVECKPREGEVEIEYQTILARTKELQEMCAHPTPPGISPAPVVSWTGVCQTCHKAFY